MGEVWRGVPEIFLCCLKPVELYKKAEFFPTVQPLTFSEEEEEWEEEEWEEEEDFEEEEWEEEEEEWEEEEDEF
jgi:proline/glutamate/leucine-rich protein 1